MCLHIIHGYLTGAGTVIRNGGDPGGLIPGIGMPVFITTISIFILGITAEPMCIAILDGINGITEIMAGDPGRPFM